MFPSLSACRMKCIVSIVLGHSAFFLKCLFQRTNKGEAICFLMKVIFDIDDVVLDTIPTLVDEYNRVYRDSFRWEDVTTIPFYDSLPKISSPQEAKQFMKSFTENQGYLRVPFIRFAKKSLGYLHENYTVGFASARHLTGQQAILDVFEKNNFSSNITFTHEKGLLARDLQPEYWFDDSISHLDAIKQHSPETRTYLFSRPWNKGPTSHPRVSTWVDILKKF